MENNSRRNFITGATAAAVATGLNIKSADSKETKKENTKKRFDNKVVLITGATSGIGEAAAISFAQEGAKVFFCGRRIEMGNKVEAKIKSNGGEATFFRADVTSKKELQSFVEECVKKYGKIDIAFNNAGFDINLKGFLDYTEDEYNKIMDTNLGGLYWSMHFEAKEMLKNKSGTILNMSSVAGHRAISSAAYVASKHGVVGLTKSAAYDQSLKGLRINCISPGIIKTEFTKGYQDYFTKHPELMGLVNSSFRFGEIKEVVSLVLWLCSDEASFVHGADFHVDGGANFG